MALPPLATVADLEAAMQVAAGALPAASADLAINRASARVRRYIRQDITRVDSETIELPGGQRVLQLPQYPLIVDADHPLTVVEVADFGGVDFDAVEGRDYSRLGNELTRGYPWQATTRLMGWPWNRPTGVWAPKVRVTYSHGYDEIPEDIVDVVLDLATLNMSNPENLRSSAIDDYSRTYASETIGNAKLGRGHQEDLRPYRRSAFSVVSS